MGWGRRSEDIINRISHSCSHELRKTGKMLNKTSGLIVFKNTFNRLLNTENSCKIQHSHAIFIVRKERTRYDLGLFGLIQNYLNNI